MDGLLDLVGGGEIERLLKDPLLWLAGALALVALFQTWRVIWISGEPSRRAKKRVARAKRGEIEGEQFLREMGFHILAVQPEYIWKVQVDGKAAKILLRPDLLVEQGGRRYVADVKTGAVAPDPLSSATRRQLLEYMLACGVDGVLVIDMEARRIRSLAFPLGPAASPAGRGRTGLALLVGLGLGFGAAWGLDAAGWASERSAGSGPAGRVLGYTRPR